MLRARFSIRSRHLAFVLGVFLTSCRCGPQSYDIDVELGFGFVPGSIPAIEVDLVLLTESEFGFWGWDKLSVDNYFADGTREARLREEYSIKRNIRTLFFEERSRRAQLIRAHDRFWKNNIENGAKYLVIIADVPLKAPAGEAPEEDRRRSVIALDWERWKVDTIEVEVVEGIGVRVVTPQREVDEG